VDTFMMESSITWVGEKTGQEEAALRAHFVEQSPQKRLFTVDEVADTIAFFALENSRGISGQALALDGGELVG